MDMDEILLRDDEYHGDGDGYGDGDETSLAPPPPSMRILDFLESGLPQSEPLKLNSMLGPKLYAIVEEIGGQIYILWP